MKNMTSQIGLPSGLITTFSNGCQGYQPLTNVPFSPQIKNTFNPELAAWSINACTYAYQDLCHPTNITYPPEIEDGKLLYWNESVGFFSKPKIASGYIGRIKPIPGDTTNRIAILFRGTQTLDEWELDAQVEQIEIIFQPPGELVKIHKGFWDITNTPPQKNSPSLTDQIHTLLPNYLSSDPTVINELHIGGHSMGSAVATLVTINTILAYPNLRVNTYITGSPRVGNPAFANAITRLANDSAYNFSIWRIANTEDIITTLPEPVFKDLLYSHIQITESTAPNAVNLISFTKNLGKIFDNHHLFNYFYAMRKLILQSTTK